MDRIYAYKQGSASALALAQGLGIKVLKHEGSKYKPKVGRDMVINWGCSELPELFKDVAVINKPEVVKCASNKLSFFEAVQGDVMTPDFTTDTLVVQAWLDDGQTVVVRHKLNGHSGEGIEIIKGDVDIPEAKLYVKYVPKKDEYRVHVLAGQVVDVQRKARNKEVADDQVNWQVRNHHNGFIFVRGDVEAPPPVLEQAVKAVEVCGLDFGAVDIIWNDKHKSAYVLEVNTAPGLTGTTLEGYINRFKELLA